MMAAEFVLGTLNRAMLLQFKDELTNNPALREAVKDWERRLGVERTGVACQPKAQSDLKTARQPSIQGAGGDQENGKTAATDVAVPVNNLEEAASPPIVEAVRSEPQTGLRASETGPEAEKSEAEPEAEQWVEPTQPQSVKAESAESTESQAPADKATRENPLVLRAEEGEWEALAPRVYKKLLNRDDSFNRQSYLLRMIPGGRIQPQRRGGIEEVYILEGRLSIGENSLGPGDFHAFPAKSFVPEFTASSDSLILVRGHIAERIPDPAGTA
ncbi:hypothetical protein [Pelagibius sp. Alg239-R121]|uniref:cupin domain-containing protein n=1 Tax=Pelagibius sp. Alg239-R121 TaxID=2993448 RepID=UPI0024A65550|nr:hypothetical protein [Pelagibius sp. Alg239-R121]